LELLRGPRDCKATVRTEVPIGLRGCAVLHWTSAQRQSGLDLLRLSSSHLTQSGREAPVDPKLSVVKDSSQRFHPQPRISERCDDFHCRRRKVRGTRLACFRVPQQSTKASRPTSA
jgi:hypothetical protein